MRIILIGDFSPQFDEGLKNIGKYISHYLSMDYDVLQINIKKSYQVENIIKMKKFDADVVHFLIGNTLKGVLLANFLKINLKIPIVFSITHPQFYIEIKQLLNSRNFLKYLLRYNKIDYILIQSSKYQSKLISILKSKVNILSNGVDLEKFNIINSEKINQIRKKYNYQPQDKIILHVGHLRKNRNLKLLTTCNKNYRIIIISSLYQGVENDIYDELSEHKNVRIITKYITNLKDYYNMADVYAFPVKSNKTIDTPLSILEAMACNCRIVTMPHRGLLEKFGSTPGMIISSEEQFCKDIDSIFSSEPKTRENVYPFSWNKICFEIIKIYKELVI